MGGRGSSSRMTANQNTKKASPLAAFTENARQFNEAKQKASEGNYYALEFTDIAGNKQTLYSQGSGGYDIQENAMERAFSKRQGTLHIEFNPDKLDPANKAKWLSGNQDRVVNEVIDRAVQYSNGGITKDDIAKAVKDELKISSRKATTLVNNALRKRKSE